MQVLSDKSQCHRCRLASAGSSCLSSVACCVMYNNHKLRFDLDSDRRTSQTYSNASWTGSPYPQSVQTNR